MPEPRTLLLLAVVAVVSGAAGAAAGRATAPVPEPIAAEDAPIDEAPAAETALVECEARLEAAELGLAQRAPVDAPAIDPASLPEEARTVIASPEVSRAIEQEVERRIGERFERERERRRAEWAERRAELRERMHAIGIDDATIDAVTPQMCAIRDVFRSAWREGRGRGGGDADVRTSRRAIMEQTQPMRDEVAGILGDERMARLEEEGGLRALGGAISCGDDEGGPPGRSR